MARRCVAVSTAYLTVLPLSQHFGAFGSRQRSAVQVLSAFETDTELVLAHIDIAEKSNEIPAAQKLLAELGLADGAIVMMDALHCQKKTFEVAAEVNIALIVQVKDNQATLTRRSRESPRQRPRSMRSAVVPGAAIATNGAPSRSSIRQKNSPRRDGIRTSPRSFASNAKCSPAWFRTACRTGPPRPPSTSRTQCSPL